MKRITLNVDLEDQILDKELDRLIQSRAVQITRETFDQLIRKEIDSRVDAAFNSLSYSYWDTTIRGEVALRVANKILNEYSGKMDGIIDKSIQKFISTAFSNFILEQDHA